MNSLRKPQLFIIVAMGKNRLIGIDNNLPWHLPNDLKHFKEATLGKPIVMGRKTFESFGSTPLPKRPNLVVSRNMDYVAQGAEVFPSVEEALASQKDAAEIAIIGGAQIYEQWINKVDKLIITLVDAELEGDAYFPAIDLTIWQEVSRKHHPQDAKHKYAFDFVEYKKK